MICKKVASTAASFCIFLLMNIYIHICVCEKNIYKNAFFHKHSKSTISEEFPHRNNRDCDVLVSLLGGSLIKMASEATDGRSESLEEPSYHPFTLRKLKLSRGSTIYIS